MTTNSCPSDPKMTKQLRNQDRSLRMILNVRATAAVRTRTRTETMNGAKTSTEEKKRMTARDRIIALPIVTEEIMSTPQDVTTKRESATRIAAAAGKKKTARTDIEIAIEIATENTAVDTAAAAGSTLSMALPPRAAATRALTRPRVRVDLTSKEVLAAPEPPRPRRKMRIL
jgi:hypothetical protein